MMAGHSQTGREGDCTNLRIAGHGMNRLPQAGMHASRSCSRTVDGSTIICMGAADRRGAQAGPRHERCAERDSGSGRSDGAPIDDGENA